MPFDSRSVSRSGCAIGVSLGGPLPADEDRPPEVIPAVADVRVLRTLVPGADVGCIRVVRIFRQPGLDGTPVERLVSIPIVVRRRDEGGGHEPTGLEDRNGALERRERLVAVDVVGWQLRCHPERLTDCDVTAGVNSRLERIERARQASPDEARAETESDVVL